jgi:hypothetical protein
MLIANGSRYLLQIHRPGVATLPLRKTLQMNDATAIQIVQALHQIGSQLQQLNQNLQNTYHYLHQISQRVGQR